MDSRNLIKKEALSHTRNGLFRQSNNFTFVLALFFLSLCQSGIAQTYEIRGRVVNADTKKAIDSASITVYAYGNINFESCITDSTGLFSFDCLREGRYSFYIEHDDYKLGHETIEITDSSVFCELGLYHMDSSGGTDFDDIADEDIYHGGFAVNFYNPNIGTSFKSSFNIEYLYSFKKKVAKFDQIGLELLPIKMVWHKLENDSSQISGRSGERYFGYYFSAFMYNRLIITKQKETDYPGIFLDLGLGYELPLSFKYAYKTDSHTKTRTGNIHKLNEIVGLVRIGFDIVSIKASYRFTDILKGDYPEPPRLKIGIEINASPRYM